MDLLKTQLTLTKEETAGLLAADPFGLIVWGKPMRTERDAMSFAVHTELINGNNPTMGVYHGCLLYARLANSAGVYHRCFPQDVYHGCLLHGVYHECLPLSPFSLLQPNKGSLRDFKKY
jgi:hypothetical protein